MNTHRTIGIALILILPLMSVPGRAQNGQELQKMMTQWSRVGVDEESYSAKTSELSDAFRKNGLYTRAKDVLVQAIDQLEQANLSESTDFAVLLSELAALYLHREDFQIARGLYLEAEGVLSKKPKFVNSDEFLTIKLQRALLDARLGNNLAAVGAFNQVRTLYEKKYTHNHERTLNVILGIAEVYLEINNPKRAESYLNDALWTIQNLPEVSAPLAIRLNKGLSQLFFEKEQPDSAIKYQLVALNLTAQEYSALSHPFSIELLELARLLYGLGRIEEALDKVKEATDIQITSTGDYHKVYLEGVLLSAELNHLQSKYDDAATDYAKAANGYSHQLAILNPILKPSEREHYLGALAKILGRMANLAEALGPDANSKALIGQILDLKIKYNDLVIQPAQSERLEAERRDGLERMVFFLRRPLDGDPARAKELQGQEDLVSKLKIGPDEVNGRNWRSIAKELGDSTCAIEVLRYPQFHFSNQQQEMVEVHYAFFVVDNHRASPNFKAITHGIDLENKYLSHYRNSINHRFFDEYGYTMYWKPLDSILHEYQTIFLSPAGAYRQLNLRTLKKADTMEFLVDKKAVHLVSSIASIGPPSSDVTTGVPEVFISGNPDYYMESNPDSSKHFSPYDILTSNHGESGMLFIRDKIKQHILWNELLYTDELKKFEVDLLEDLYASEGFNVNTLIEANAVESAIKKLNSPNTLHISSHGYFMESENGKGQNVATENKLLSSGLIFSGSYDYLDAATINPASDDGLLTAMEIAMLDLAGTELVFLSSCETGLGIVNNGEAIAHFQNAFHQAGANSLIMSLWTVEAEYEVEFMNLFYFHWLFEKLPKRAAFLKSQMIMKENYEKPYYWGSFVYIGN